MFCHAVFQKRNALLSKIYRSEKHALLTDVNQRCGYCDHSCNSLLQLAFDACCLSLRSTPGGSGGANALTSPSVGAVPNYASAEMERVCSSMTSSTSMDIRYGI